MSHILDRVLAVFPTRTGFGWALFEGPDNPVDWGVATIGKDRNAACLARIEELIDRCQPTSLVLEEFEGPSSRRAARIRDLGRDILDLANTKGADTQVYSRAEVTAAFLEVGAETRYEIATAIAARIEPFAHLLPPPRKIWMPEDPRMGLFNAAAVALAHYAHSASFD